MRIAAFGAISLLICNAAALQEWENLQQVSSEEIFAQVGRHKHSRHNEEHHKNEAEKADRRHKRKYTHSNDMFNPNARNYKPKHPRKTKSKKGSGCEHSCTPHNHPNKSRGPSIEIPTGKTQEEKAKFKEIFDKLSEDTKAAVKVIEKLGGIKNVPKVKPESPVKRCCCWGTPIGDKLLSLAEELDRDGMVIMAQIESHHSHTDEDESVFSQMFKSDMDKTFLNLATDIEQDRKLSDFSNVYNKVPNGTGNTTTDEIKVVKKSKDEDTDEKKDTSGEDDKDEEKSKKKKTKSSEDDADND